MAYCSSIGHLPAVDDVVDHLELDDKLAVIHFKSGKKVPVHVRQEPTGADVLLTPQSISNEADNRYCIISAAHVTSLATDVNLKIKKGYKPLGAPFYSISPGSRVGPTYHQALIKE